MSIVDVIYHVKSVVQVSNSEVIEEFVMNVDLVMEGLRAVYFIDSSVINIQKTREIICAIYSYLQVLRKVVIIILPDDTGDDKPDQLGVLNPMRLMKSYEFLESDEWAYSFLPISICSIAPFRCPDEMLATVQKELLITLGPLNDLCSTCSVTQDHLFVEPLASDIRIMKIVNNRDVVGNIFLEGFLEDFVCIYHRPSPPPTPDLTTSNDRVKLTLSDVPHCLYLTTLKRVTLTAVCRNNRHDTDVATISTQGSDEATYLITICEFTVPKTYLDSSSEILFSFNDMVKRKVLELKATASSSQLVLNVLLFQDEFKLDSFNLSADKRIHF